MHECVKPESVQLLETAGIIGLITLIFIVIGVILWRA